MRHGKHLADVAVFQNKIPRKLLKIKQFKKKCNSFIIGLLILMFSLLQLWFSFQEVLREISGQLTEASCFISPLFDAI